MYTVSKSKTPLLPWVAGQKECTIVNGVMIFRLDCVSLMGGFV